MAALLYIRLTGYAAGTLLMLFWMVVILGYRRQRNFERVFFFLCLALFFFYGGSLLALNAKIHYPAPPIGLTSLADVLVLTGLCILPPVLIHLHLEYAETRGLIRSRQAKRLMLSLAYVPALYFALRVYGLLAATPGFEAGAPGRLLGRAYGVWLIFALAVGTYWQARFWAAAPDRPQRSFHRHLTIFMPMVLLLVGYLHFVNTLTGAGADAVTTGLAILGILPFALLLEMVFRFNFLNIGTQKNLVYAVSVIFLALLYLSLVRRAALWLEPLLPPEATAAILVFLLVIFIEPLQRVIAKRLREAAQSTMDRVQKLMVEIQMEARQGNGARLVSFIEGRVREQLGLREVQLELYDEDISRAAKAGGLETLRPEKLPESRRESRAAIPFSPREFPIHRDLQTIGMLRIEPHGAGISGDTSAALEFLCEQLPGVLDLCRLIEEKLRLERELAERERMAALGQMAASVSHNLKNPLGSIKTILQVQLESPELPDSLRSETKLMLEEVSRLSAKLNQLLQFSRPAVAGAEKRGGCDATTIAREIIGVMRHGAEEKGLHLELSPAAQAARVAAGTEAVNDILSNLVVNALDATPRGGHVRIEIAKKNGQCILSVEDDGPGIPADLREKILQPFFTTKAQGTGLGLAIVARRVAEAGGALDFQSPASNDHGTRFVVALPLAQEEGEGH
jgi:signal transduction histidine kinase